MYFFDIVDYISSCFFGPNSVQSGDPEDMWTTFRATRDAWLKAKNQHVLSYTACATCSSTIIGVVDVEITNAFDDYMDYLSSAEYCTAYARLYNMIPALYRYPTSTVATHNAAIGCPNPLPANFSFGDASQGCIFTGLHNVPIFNTAISGTIMGYVNDVDFGNGEWSLEFFNDYVNILIQSDCLFKKYFNLTTNNLIKESEMTNFNQIV
jgi:hypothetical protein